MHFSQQVSSSNSFCRRAKKDFIKLTLGLGKMGFYLKHGCHRRTPRLLSHQSELPVSALLSAAEIVFEHNFLEIFGFVACSSGQLGIGEEADKFYPTLCKSLRSQKVTYVSCGENFTAVLTKVPIRFFTSAIQS